jgi:hypothetical protein
LCELLLVVFNLILQISLIIKVLILQSIASLLGLLLIILKLSSHRKLSFHSLGVNLLHVIILCEFDHWLHLLTHMTLEGGIKWQG